MEWGYISVFNCNQWTLLQVFKLKWTFSWSWAQTGSWCTSNLNLRERKHTQKITYKEGMIQTCHWEKEVLNNDEYIYFPSGIIIGTAVLNTPRTLWSFPKRLLIGSLWCNNNNWCHAASLTGSKGRLNFLSRFPAQWQTEPHSENQVNSKPI